MDDATSEGTRAEAIDLASASPIIVAGMHRSGTGLVSRLLMRAGVHMGVDLDENHESRLFMELDRWLLEAHGYAWRSVDEVFATIHELHSASETGVAHIREALEERLVEEHFGGRVRAPWGWKDPRTSLLLPEWKRVFPHTSLVHVYRDGRDVALSLMERDGRQWGFDPARPTRPRVERFLADVYLWERYERQVREHAALFERRVTVRYEELLEDPVRLFGGVLETLGVEPTESVEEVVHVVDASRARRVERAPYPWVSELEIRSPLLRELGYV